MAAHLGTGGHGDIQVAEDVLGVLVFHRLSQERQEPSWLATAVPHLDSITHRELYQGPGCLQAGVLQGFLPPKLLDQENRVARGGQQPSQGWPSGSLETTGSGSFAVGLLS